MSEGRRWRARLKIGFDGLGRVGGKFNGSIPRNGYDLTVRGRDQTVEQPCLDLGARHADCMPEMAETRDTVIGTRPGKVVTSCTITLWSCFTAFHAFSAR